MQTAFKLKITCEQDSTKLITETYHVNQNKLKEVWRKLTNILQQEMETLNKSHPFDLDNNIK